MRIDDGKEMHAGLRHVAAVNKKSMRTCAIAGFPVGTMVAHLENSESKARKLSMYRSMDLKYAVPRCGARTTCPPPPPKAPSRHHRVREALHRFTVSIMDHWGKIRPGDARFTGPHY